MHYYAAVAGAAHPLSLSLPFNHFSHRVSKWKYRSKRASVKRPKCLSRSGVAKQMKLNDPLTSSIAGTKTVQLYFTKSFSLAPQPCPSSKPHANLRWVFVLKHPSPLRSTNLRCGLRLRHRHGHNHGHRHRRVAALDSDVPHPLHQGSVEFNDSESFKQWDSLTAKFSGAANVPFLLLQLPQIILNARNLLDGNKTALLAVPWLAMLTGLLGNLSLLSYFVKKREKEVIVVQTLGAVSIFIVITQLSMAEAMPLPYFVTISTVVIAGLVLNFLNYFGLLKAEIWQFWEDFITVGGLSVLPQIMWSTFVPFIPNSILPGAISFVIALVAVIMARSGKLSEKGTRFVGSISGWTATLLFMWMPVSQMWTNFLNPENIKGLSALSMLLAMMGNGLMIPRALFIRDFMWFTGSAWASLFYGYGNLVCLYCFKTISKEFFFASTAGLLLWMGTAFWRDATVRGYSSPFISLNELVFGS